MYPRNNRGLTGRGMGEAEVGSVCGDREGRWPKDLALLQRPKPIP